MSGLARGIDRMVVDTLAIPPRDARADYVDADNQRGRIRRLQTARGAMRSGAGGAWKPVVSAEMRLDLVAQVRVQAFMVRQRCAWISSPR